ncbi:hypothetical protein D9V37_14155 [Nocardioides mangrovicus]|uniref:Uncharacterized protein n=1 Tax=Nocardioides mangrovicus TaxID=2478913 RepID=A0A3L8P018_9ACTN|nr:hypothetical protein [Nocardioides mangrovicus]RLV48514.1 hypothetical protein D9V37_14155 [Nocardioides mangrovicus]
MSSHRSGSGPAHRPARTSGRTRSGEGTRGSHAAGRARHSLVARAVIAACSASAVVAATAVMVAAAASSTRSTDSGSAALRQVQDVVTTPQTPLPTHADLGANAGAVQPAVAVTTKRLAIKQRYGIDVSWPQCGTTLPTIQLDFAVIGLTDGHASSVSPCFGEQVAWAKANHLRVAVYVVPNSPGTSSTASVDMQDGRTAAETSCATADASCPAYAAGVRQARHALAAAAAAQLPRTGWWLDVEESSAGTLWSDDTVANTAVLQGWVDTLRAAHLPVGAYSTHGYWTQITGGWQADLPQWVPVGLDGITDAQQACTEPFTSGPVVMTQWLTGPYDGNLLCPSTDGDPMARAFTGRSWAQHVTAGAPALLTTPVPHPEIEQAQAEADAESQDCDPADDADDDSSGNKDANRTTDDPKSGSDDDASCDDDGKPKTKDTKPKTKTKHHGQGAGSGHTSGHSSGKPKIKHHDKPNKGKHHHG